MLSFLLFTALAGPDHVPGRTAARSGLVVSAAGAAVWGTGLALGLSPYAGKRILTLEPSYTTTTQRDGNLAMGIGAITLGVGSALVTAGAMRNRKSSGASPVWGGVAWTLWGVSTVGLATGGFLPGITYTLSTGAAAMQWRANGRNHVAIFPTRRGIQVVGRWGSRRRFELD